MLKIKDLFEKPIDRNIKGVIKVGQADEENIVQELEEYVITEELYKYIGKFFGSYKRGITGNTDKMGVWISGFFGSGKSHFLKILSYVLENKEVGNKKTTKYFDDKIHDAMLLADINMAGDTSCDVILFNIDSKSESDSKNDKEAIVKVFLKAFNEKLGFCASNFWLADLERYLVKIGKYGEFKNVINDIANEKWEDIRNDFDYRQDEILQSLIAVLSMSEESARKLCEKMESSFNTSIETFAQIVGEHIQSKGKNHHVVFLVDEMGQYVGENSQLMLNLQTVTEDLGTQCGGKAWVIVTSQQDIDKVIKVKGNDFSKITGRFDTRLSLSSANVDEVIKKRILTKTDTAKDTLKLLFQNKSAIIKNLITFDNAAEMKSYSDDTDFADNYPFLPYQFNLLQKVFNGIREHGASGKHLSEGERSLLSAFQESAMTLMEQDSGVIAPFSTFYNTIEAFLDHNIKSVIIHASKNLRLHPFDVEVLKLLFLTKYVKEIPSNLENITTLMINNIDVDKLGLKKQIEGSLESLINEVLIQKNGDEYIFLTNEEQDINKEIRNMPIEVSVIEDKAGEIIFEEIYADKKYKYSPYYNFAFNTFIDDRPRGSQGNEIGIKIITPYFYEDVDSSSLKMMSSGDKNIIIKLSNDATFLEELTEILKIDAYTRLRGGNSLSPERDEIRSRKLRERSDRYQRAKTIIQEELKTADIYVNGQKQDIKEKNHIERINDAFKILIESTYTKLNYMKVCIDNPNQLRELLYSDDSQVRLQMSEEANKLAIDEINSYIERNSNLSLNTTIRTLLSLYDKQPYGWRELDILSIIIKLLRSEEIKLELNGNYLNVEDKDTINYITKREHFERVLIRRRKKTSTAFVNNARELYKLLSGKMAESNDEDGLMREFKDNLIQKDHSIIKEYLFYYKDTRYPQRNVLDEAKKKIEEITTVRDSAVFYEKLYNEKQWFLDYEEEIKQIINFFNNQKEFFDKGKKCVNLYMINKIYIEDSEIEKTVDDINTILHEEKPYSSIPRIPALIQKYNSELSVLLDQFADPIREKIIKYKEELTSFVEQNGLVDKYGGEITSKYNELIERISAANEFRDLSSINDAGRITKEKIIEKITGELNKVIVVDPIDSVKPQKQIKTLSSSKLINTKRTIETEQDIEKLIDEIRENLKNELQPNTIIKFL